MNMEEFKSLGLSEFQIIRMLNMYFEGKENLDIKEFVDVAIKYLRDREYGIFYTPGMEYTLANAKGKCHDQSSKVKYFGMNATWANRWYRSFQANEQEAAMDALSELRMFYSDTTGKDYDDPYGITPRLMVRDIEAWYEKYTKRKIEEARKNTKLDTENEMLKVLEGICTKYGLNRSLYSGKDVYETMAAICDIYEAVLKNRDNKIEELNAGRTEQEERLKELNNKLFNIRVAAGVGSADLIEGRIQEIYTELLEKIKKNAELENKLKASEDLRKWWINKYESEHTRANSLNRKHVEDLKTIDKAIQENVELRKQLATANTAVKVLRKRLRKIDEEE